jgi:hypothetical protein
MKAAEIIATLKAQKPCYYSYEQNQRTLGTFLKAGAQQTVIATGGYRLVLTHMDNVLVSILPKAKSAGRGEIILWTGEKRDHGKVMKILDREYDTDPYGPARLHEALLITALAWETAKGNQELLYKAIGARGFCAICGANLSDELSIARGIGPECIKKVFKKPAIQFLQEKNLARA